MKKILFFLILGVLIFLIKSGFFIIDTFEYNKCEYLDSNTVQEALPKDMNYFVASSSYIKNNLLNLPVVEKVEVKKKISE